LRALMLTRHTKGRTAITGDLRQYGVRSDRQIPIEPAFTLPARLVRLTVLLPNGSTLGHYEIEVRGGDGMPRARTAGAATLQYFITRLSAEVDLTSVPTGRCQLAIRRDGDNWQLFPIGIQ